MLTDFEHKLLAFMSLLEIEMNSVAGDTLNNMGIAEGRRGYHTIGYDPGSRFCKVWDKTSGVSKSVRYFVEIETGKIFGAKSWKIYNPARQYGTLDTVTEWDWSGYSGVSKTGKSTLVPKAERV